MDILHCCKKFYNTKVEIMTYKDALKYLDWLAVFGIKEGLERINRLMTKLGEPQNFYDTVHVAGTNGKGSTCAMLAEILRAAGLNVGLFTSPHLVSYCERISVNGENISETDFAAQIELVKNCGVECTHFEALTAAAFDYFKRRHVDIAVIEVGLGGTFDSTNIISPELCIITTVALDHEKILGDLNSIARNKAGIIRANVPTVTGADGVPLKIIRAVA
ncbi:MAG: bifunctional folylpolyglutamate synthase/dihydrofolate synthase, partial [Selenomonadaceae bacterium]|nr:bifunctional folylpolyglutamate synthase/dihydrofolate synthase [Selenomonadaceae bacterium]